MKGEEYLGKRYEDTDGYFVVTGLITSPAITMRNPVTGEEKTVVIGSPNHQSMREVSPEDAVRFLESRMDQRLFLDPERARKLRHVYMAEPSMTFPVEPL